MPYDYKAAYDAELQQREGLRSSLGAPVGLGTLLGTVQGFMAQKSPISADPMAVLFWVFAALGGITLACAAYTMVRAMHGHTYKRLPLAQQLRAYHNKLREWHKAYSSDPAGAETDFDAYLEEGYATAASHNATINLARSEHLFQTNKWLVISAIFTGASLIPFICNLHLI